MGAVTFSLDPVLLDCLRSALRPEVFVETGTFEGGTAEQAAAAVPEVHTVELAEEYYRRARERLARFPSVHVYHGESPAVLRSLRPRLEGRRVIYWLDAHWCDAGETAGAESQCPLLDELAAIGNLNAGSAVLIDDARFFLCPPPGAHRVEQWPSLDGLVSRLFATGPAHELMIVSDVICLYPRSAADAMRGLARAHAFDWLRAADKARAYDALLAQLAEKEALIGKLHGAAEDLRASLIAAHERIRFNEERYERLLRTPLKYARMSARVAASGLFRKVLPRKSA